MVKRRINAKGRSRDSSHVRLFHFMTGSAAWADLSGNAVKLLVHLARFETGANNGELFLSERMAAEGIGVAKRTAAKLFDELEDHGFIAPTAKGYFSTQRAATQWRLTWVPWAGKAATNEWRSWRPKEKSRGQLLHVPGAEIAPETTVRRTTGAEIAPVEAVAAQASGAKIDPQSIAIVRDRPAQSCQSNSTLQISVGPRALVQRVGREVGR